MELRTDRKRKMEESRLEPNKKRYRKRGLEKNHGRKDSE